MKSSEELKELSIKEFSRAAKIYDDDDSGVYDMCREDYPKILEEIKKEKFSYLLDSGCGTGPMISLLSEEYPDARFVGLDLTPEMIEKAKEKRIENAEFVVGDAEEMPFGEDTFDIVICSQSFHHYPNPERFFESVYKVLKPGGKLILRDNTSNIFLVWFANHILLRLCNIFGYGDAKIYTVERITEMANKAGLTVEICRKEAKKRLHSVMRKPE